MSEFSGKVAIVTGGGSGIGEATARLFAQMGASVVVADRNTDKAQRVAGAVKAAGGEAFAITCDVTKDADIVRMVLETVEHYKRLDFGINNAGIVGPVMPLTDYNLSDAREVIAVNLTGVLVCMQEQLRVMVPKACGVIVNTCSIWGRVAGANYSAYCASKHGVAGLTKAVALEVAPIGIRVNAVCPGFTETPMLTDGGVIPGTKEYKEASEAHPMGRLGKPIDIAEGIAWLCSPRSSFVTGECLAIDGGYLAR